MDISALATEELLAVFRFLTARELLRCRAVCHRWAWLAQDPVLWSSRCVDADVSKDLESDSHRKFVAAILNFAPCFGELVVDLSSPGADSLWSALISTSCAISKVVFNCSASDAVHAALIISRQVLLGRLKALKLEVDVDRSDTPEPPGSDRSLMSLLIHITHIQGLEELYFNRDDLVSLPPEEPAKSLGRASAPVSASLKRLTVVNCHSFCELLLQWHADTLEFVRWLSVEPPSALAVHLLCRIPRLRELACAPLEGMRALLQCPSLDRLEIFFNGGPTFAAHLPEACDLVRGLACTRLEQLVLVPTRDMVASASEVLRCLKSSGRSTAVLRSLRLHLECEAPLSGPLYQQPVVELLHQLPLLSLLDVDSVLTAPLLQTLDGRVVPELRQLLMRLPAESALGCDHLFIHSEGVRTLLRNYPRLHVVVKDVKFADDCDRALCCRDACHAVPRGAWCMLFGHDARARCDVPHRPYYLDYFSDEVAVCVAFHIATSTA